LYDEDGDGHLTAVELEKGMKDTFRLLGHDVDSEKFSQIISSRVKKLMEAADENGDGEITLEEIKAAVKKQPKLLLIF
jgi:Ca2+-binding EF-hand superfamily protein